MTITSRCQVLSASAVRSVLLPRATHHHPDLSRATSQLVKRGHLLHQEFQLKADRLAVQGLEDCDALNSGCGGEIGRTMNQVLSHPDFSASIENCNCVCKMTALLHCIGKACSCASGVGSWAPPIYLGYMAFLAACQTYQVGSCFRLTSDGPCMVAQQTRRINKEAHSAQTQPMSKQFSVLDRNQFRRDWTVRADENLWIQLFQAENWARSKHNFSRCFRALLKKRNT